MSEVEYARIEKAAAEYGIPDYMIPGIARYLIKKTVPGGFLVSVITNNLSGAVGSADATNIRLLPNYVKFFYNEAPQAAWGSAEKMQAWLES